MKFSNYDETTNVDAWLEDYAVDHNTFWTTDSGHMENVVAELVDRLAKAYTSARNDAADAVEREADTLPAEVFPPDTVTTLFVKSIILRCADVAREDPGAKAERKNEEVLASIIGTANRAEEK